MNIPIHMKSPAFFLPLLFAFLMACEGKVEESREAVEEKLGMKRTELRELQEEISTLEDSLESYETGDGEGKGIDPLVRTRSLEPTLFEHFVKVNASVEADNEVLLSSERQGKLQKVLVEEGDEVSKGQTVAVQSQAVLRNQLQEARTRYEHARTVFEKQERLWKEKGIGSEMEYLNARSEKETLHSRVRSLEEELEMTEIVSPIDGTVEEVNLKEGAFADPSRPIAHIVGLEKLFVKADLSERYLNRIGEEDSVEILFSDLGMRFIRPIHSLGDRIHPQDRTFKVRVRLENTEDRAIKPNLSATMRIRDLKVDSAMVLPSALVSSDPEGDFVYLVRDDDTAEKRYIELGPSQGANSLVREGLDPGDDLVIAGYGRLSDGMKVRKEEVENESNAKKGSSSDDGTEG